MESKVRKIPMELHVGGECVGAVIYNEVVCRTHGDSTLNGGKSELDGYWCERGEDSRQWLEPKHAWGVRGAAMPGAAGENLRRRL